MSHFDSHDHDEFGSLEPGKLADLILVDGDPTADISDIRRAETVTRDGRVDDATGLAALRFADPVAYDAA